MPKSGVQCTTRVQGSNNKGPTRAEGAKSWGTEEFQALLDRQFRTKPGSVAGWRLPSHYSTCSDGTFVYRFSTTILSRLALHGPTPGISNHCRFATIPTLYFFGLR